jgi:FkbM family methyltransferase
MHFGQYGEDAFLQAYFHAKATDLHSGIPHHFSQNYLNKGFYIDVGAYSPKLFSNTYWFYKRGWRGINIDATPRVMESFRGCRSRDINIEVAVSDKTGHQTFYSWDSPFPVNTFSPERAKHFSRVFNRQPQQIEVETARLDQILDDYLPEGQEISFLSIDVEETDLAVLRSNNWQNYRPELVLVENSANSPENLINSDITCFMGQQGYKVYSWIRPTVVYREPKHKDPLIPRI